MFANRHFSTIFAASASLAALLTIPTAAALTAPTGEAPKLAYDLPLDIPAAEPVAAPALPAETVAIDARSVECMSKVVHHEAKNQPRRGQLAVAQAMVNRLHAGRFGDSICAVAAQRGQFFDVAHYKPRQDTNEWEVAEDVSREALSGAADQVAPGAMFFRASYAPANSFFRTRQRVTQVGAHIFYR